jgi:hypothetical protein
MPTKKEYRDRYNLVLGVLIGALFGYISSYIAGYHFYSLEHPEVQWITLLISIVF